MKRDIFFIYFAFLIGSISASLKTRIIGGADADIRNFPYQASLRYKGKHFCGACIIGTKHILTAAHCVQYDVPPFRDLSISTGTSKTTETGNSYRIASVSVHPEYLGSYQSYYRNDIAVITLASDIQFNPMQYKVYLPTRDLIAGMYGTLTGWGEMSQRSNQAAVNLQKLKMVILNIDQCRSVLFQQLSDKQICGIHSTGHGACVGDSGGPLVVDNQVIGILSGVFADNCANGTPEVFTNVYMHREFIISRMI